MAYISTKSGLTISLEPAKLIPFPKALPVRKVFASTLFKFLPV